MEKVEAYSWLFVYKKWGELSRMPIPDKGFEESFRDYIYRKVEFNIKSNLRDKGFGLSYLSFSSVPHELDVICVKDRDLFVFELKHYEVSSITKKIVFTFLGKVMDFYFRNAILLSDYKITMILLTIDGRIDDNIRKLCLTFGIKLIEPTLMTLKTMDYFARDLYQKIQEEDKLKSDIEKLIGDINSLKECYDYSFSDIFRYKGGKKDGKIEIDIPFSEIDPNRTLHKIKEYYNLLLSYNEIFRRVR